MEPTHASFFSGVGGLDLGLERAGWRTVSFSEIDPYACAVLAERWPGVPNVGDITELARADVGQSEQGVELSATGVGPNRWTAATLWTGGFPCQDLSVAGKRRGMVDGTRSNLAFAFLALVERHRPPAILLENVPGLLSSHRGRDMAALLGRMVELGYGVAYRVLDAQHFGVPQRRRRVFIVGLRSGPDDVGGRIAAERAAAVLSVGARCGRHPATGHEAGAGTAERTTVGALSVGGHVGIQPNGQDAYTGHIGIFGPPPDADRVRAADGLAGRAHDRGVAVSENQRGEVLLTEIAHQLTSGGGKPGQGYSAVLAPTLRVGPAKAADGGPGDTVPIIADTLNSGGNNGGFRTEPGAHLSVGDLGQLESPDPLLPLGLDSHRYRCCGNGVVAPVAEWIGRALMQVTTPIRSARLGHSPAGLVAAAASTNGGPPPGAERRVSEG